MNILANEKMTETLLVQAEPRVEVIRWSWSETELANACAGNKLVLANSINEANQQAAHSNEIQTLTRYLTFMSKREIVLISSMPMSKQRLHIDGPLVIRVTSGTSLEQVVAIASEASTRDRSFPLFCVAARRRGTTDLIEAISALRATSVQAIWLYDSSEKVFGEDLATGDDFDWTNALHHRCGSSLAGIYVGANFEVSLRACSHFAHSLRRHS